MTTSRTDFNQTWLTEMPQNIGKLELYDWLVYNIKDLINSGAKVLELSDTLRKIDGEQVKHYWYQDKKGEILLGAELENRPQGLVVTGLAKKLNLSGPPYASSLYADILADNNRSIRIISDKDMSPEAFNVWAKLLTLGHKISVYDSSKPGQTFTTISSIEELMNYYKEDDTDYRKYHFVLSEQGNDFLNTKSYFNTRRMRELSGMNLED